MNDEQLLINEMNDFEDFMENADVEEIKKEHGLSLVSSISPKFKEGVYSWFNITKISDDSITIYNPHRKSIDLPLYHNNNRYYFFLDCNYISRGIAFDDISNNIYGLLLEEVNTWIISDFSLAPVNGIEPYLDLYYKHNPVIEFIQGEIVESPQDIHKRICDNFDIVEKTLYDICVYLKTIRDNKYYKQLGYDTFETYCLENFNLNRRTVYRYISVAENLPSDFVTSMSQNGVGVTKLDILSRLSDEERTELLETTDIEHTPVKQVEQKAKELKTSREVSSVWNGSTSKVVPAPKDKDDDNSSSYQSVSKEKKFISKYGKEMNALMLVICDNLKQLSKDLIICSGCLDTSREYLNYEQLLTSPYNIDNFNVNLSKIIDITKLNNTVKALSMWIQNFNHIAYDSRDPVDVNDIKDVLCGLVNEEDNPNA